MRLHGYFRSSSSHRCRIALNLKGVTAEAAFVHLRRGEQRAEGFLALNPQGMLPALETDEGTLTQSLAICEYLDEVIPDPPLLPERPMARARARALAQAIACDIHPLQNLRVLQYLRETYGQDEDGVRAWCQRWIGDGLQACEALLTAEDHGGPYAMGDEPGLADICLVPQVMSARRFQVSLDAMPRLRAVFDACLELDAFQRAQPAAQPDAEA